MAFRPQSGITSAYPVLEGITFVLNERCRPPPKVTLPIKFETGNAAEVVFLEYDTSLEKEVLRRCAAEREALMAELERRKQELTAAESAKKGSPAQDAPSDDPGAQVENEVQEQIGSNVPDPSPIVPPKSDGLLPTVRTGPGGILIPMPATSVAGGLAVSDTSHGLFDLKDFETEQDPFENLSLRVMNDREELRNVFRATTALQRTNEGEPSSATAAAAVGADPAKNASTSAAVEAPPSQSSALLQYMNGAPSSGSSSAISFVPCQQIPNPPSLGYPAAAAAVGNPSSHNLFVGASPVNLAAHNPALSSVAYSSDYNKISFVNGPDARQPMAVPSTLLRSAKSTPDISNLTSEANAANCGDRRTPPPPSSTKPRAIFYDSSKSTATMFQPPVVKPVPVTIPSMHSNDVAVPPSSAPSRSAAYLSLPAESQHFVDVIRDMGFDEVDVVRAVKELGVDDKLVLDHLCQLGQLREKGLSASDSAAALFLFDNSIEKAETYLKLVKNFSELGFQRDRIREVLVTNNLDEDKCLDLLIGT